jgi:hypothetical protein
MVNQFLSFLTGKILDDLSELLRMVESFFSPPELFDDLVFEKLSHVGDIGLLSESLLEELDDIARLELGQITDLFLSLGVVDE